MRATVAEIALDPKSGGQEALYTYRVPPGTPVGEAFFVPLGNRLALGFATRVFEADEATLGFPMEQLREAGSRVEGLSLPEGLIALARYTQEETLSPLPVALSAATPPGVRERLVTAWTLTEAGERVFQTGAGLFGEAEIAPEAVLTPLQREVLRTLRDAGGMLVESKTRRIEAGTLRALKLLRSKGMVQDVLSLASDAERQKTEQLFALTADESRIEAFLKKEGKKKPAQALTLMRLQATEHAGLALAEIKALAGVTETTLRALIQAGYLESAQAEAPSRRTPPPANRYQQLAIDAIASSIEGGEFRPFLLYGVTGSGKTEVYLRAAAEALRAGRQVLYLVPEIALATQAIAQLRERFGRRVSVLHSELSPTQRLQNWRRIRAGEAPIVLGARSALFAPLTNLGLIVMDEEHEGSYKQETAPRYHAKRLARFLAERHACPLVLGSATPSIESFYEAEHERLTLLSLPERAASAKLPSVQIEDLTAGYRFGRPAILSEALHERLVRTLERGEQAILFLNRRAYAPFLICRDCGHQIVCPHCTVTLTYHRAENRLRCHHCGFHTSPPDTCPQCQGLRLSPFGVGTEKVEEAVREAFPETSVGRLDRDIARKKGALEETLALFRSGELQVLVGTQMVAKGLDFPNVTLVGVIAADTSLNIPDFRASERTFQLLSQVAGRAGRGVSPGHVIVQTFNPEHIAVQAASRHDYLGLYETLRVEREAAGYPPYRRMVNLVWSGLNRSEVIQASTDAAERLAKLPQVELLGPADCVLERIQRRWRRHLLLKLLPEADLAALNDALAKFDPPGVQQVVDVDPYSLM